VESAPVVTRHWLRESCKNLKVLVAEDNRVNQKLTLRLLEKMERAGVEVTAQDLPTATPMALKALV